MKTTICRIESMEPYRQSPPIAVVTLTEAGVVIDCPSDEDRGRLEAVYRQDYSTLGPVDIGDPFAFATGIVTYKAGTEEHFRAVTLDIWRIGYDWVKDQTYLGMGRRGRGE